MKPPAAASATPAAKSSSKTRPDYGQQDRQPVEYLPPLKPRRKLVLVLSLIFAVWVALLTVLYFTTVYPQRSSSNPALKTQESGKAERR